MTMLPEHDPGWRHYATAHLRIGPPPALKLDLTRPVSASDRGRLAQLGLADGFGVVTAANPAGQPAPAEVNAAGRDALRMAVLQLGAAIVPADGLSPDARHCEHGFAVALPRDACVSLARRFRQSAIYWYDGATFSIVGVLAETPDLPLPLRR